MSLRPDVVKISPTDSGSVILLLNNVRFTLEIPGMTGP
jgi:hypothetical protein